MLDEALRLELRLLRERLPDDFVPWAIFLASSFLLAATVSILAASEPELSYPEGRVRMRDTL